MSNRGPLPMHHPMRLDNVHPALRSCWHPVCRTSEVPDGSVLAVRLLGEAWAVARLDGRLTAFADRCPHRMAPFSAGRICDGVLECAYHGYRFDASGTCVRIPAIGDDGRIPPAASAVAAHSVTERYGLVWIALDEPVADLIEVPEWDDPSFTIVPLPTLDWNAAAAQMVDNFLDLSHFPFLHPVTFGDPTATKVNDYEVARDGFGSVTRYRHVTRLLHDPGDPESPNTSERADVFVYQAPFTIRLRIEYLAEDVVLTILFFHQPVDATTTRLYCYDLRNDIADGRATSDGAREFQLAVAAEDKALVEQIADKSISLDVTREVHTRADRITLEMRRIMADLVDHVAARGERS
ncbi:MAG: aromatic ring-hydroxylating dioxygenase subunit alpha [Actinobacteria bacterium]|nr:aromatic ring-hydroxylating dioxygenase subunit alpha [Actinomycetota bacterium]